MKILKIKLTIFFLIFVAASDLDCIKALFNEKEKELSLAVAKVDELTQQLEELRGRHNGTTGGASGHLNPPASAELEKLRRELMVHFFFEIPVFFPLFFNENVMCRKGSECFDSTNNKIEKK